MRFDVYCACSSSEDDSEVRLSACGIVLEFTDNYGRIVHRNYTYGLASSDPELAKIQSVRLALASIKSAFRKHRTIIHLVDDHYKDISEYFESYDGRHIDEFMEMKRWYGYYDDIMIVAADIEDNNILVAKELADETIITQEMSDSGTMEF